ncbi:heavy metal translocating P-type ATPase [Saccharibacillus alkalitolerans]|uniref:Cd(2+)-exporting ATPase n=1 Tax=Saccharibacillus alkalitolerans TaxID=2705290 RepID=A0ABX0FCU1_9BACL|nr:cation-translocating P-type ATPase [Saccharibacillus alkalitolerans]NGZ77989.1 cation-translocating P-type ATPase [Saccharibacillus alkalitolerans]
MIGFIHQNQKSITFFAGFLLIMAPAVAIMGYSGLRPFILIAATFIAGLPIAIKAFQTLRMKVFGIETLVTIAVLGALLIGEYTESAVVAFLFLFGDYLEVRTLEKTRSSLKSLADMAPQEATILRGGSRVTVPVEEVAAGDRVMIRTGGKVPVDGRIVTGQALLNEAAITGESIPASKKAGDRVFGGTVIDTGYIEIIAEKVGDDTTFAKIIELVEEAQESKTKTEKFLNKFAGIYTPGIAGLSVLVYALTRDFHLAITFLVIACPGALIIGAPVSSVAGIGNGAKNGVLVKGGEAMERFAEVDTLVFDKTGTLTKGKPEVTDIKVFRSYQKEDLLRLAAQAETASEHHLGRAIVQEAKSRGLAPKQGPKDIDVIKGSGLTAAVEGRRLTIGNRKLMHANKIAIPPEAETYAAEREKAGNTVIFAAVDGKLAGFFSIADPIREEAAAALAQMRRNGINSIIMLTGDNRYTAERVATRLGLDAFHAELLPEDKAAFVKRLKQQGHVVAMAGDGVNDAPAIAAADIGVAMGEGGTDISMETADVVLMNDKLMQFSHAYSLSKATIRNIKQNTFFAVGTVAALLLGVLMGSVHLASGMFIHEASVLLVILNAMRLIGFDRKRMRREKEGKLVCVQE